MPDTPVPSDFDWVKARADCSLPVVFKQLQLSVQNDVERAKALLAPNSGVMLTVQSQGGRFSVVRSQNRSIPDSVDFVLVRDKIIVKNDEDAFLAEATLTLDNNGTCKLKVEGVELEQWQFRRTVLEKLFFGPHRT